MASYLDVALEEGDLRLDNSDAWGHRPRPEDGDSRGGDRLGRESLYKSLSADSNPEFATVLRWSAPWDYNFTRPGAGSDRRMNDHHQGQPGNGR